MIASASFTPPTRQASSWQTSIASAWNSCLKITRFCTCSPVATRIGAISRRMRACPSTSSGLVGSSIHHGSYLPRTAIAAIASSTPQAWLASIINTPSIPSTSRIRAARLGLGVGADLHLDVSETGLGGFADQASDLLVAVAEPAGGSGVGRVAACEDLRESFLASGAHR